MPIKFFGSSVKSGYVKFYGDGDRATFLNKVFVGEALSKLTTFSGVGSFGTGT